MALFTPHCAAIHPAKLVRGLARAVERLGVTIHERTAVHAIEPGRVRTSRGDVRADVVVRATEAFSPSSPVLRRALVPIYSLMIATEPLPDAFWADAGLASRPTFSDFRHMIIYGQRTADGRLAFGGRGTPYHFGSRVLPAFRPRRSRLRAPAHDVAVAVSRARRRPRSRIGGEARSRCRATGTRRSASTARTGIAWAGGYVGDGVSTTNLAGRTIADLVLGRDSDLVRLPWVGHVSPRWEPEPLRWLGVNLGRRLVESIDHAEAAGRDPRLRRRAAARLLG